MAAKLTPPRGPGEAITMNQESHSDEDPKVQSDWFTETPVHAFPLQGRARAQGTTFQLATVKLQRSLSLQRGFQKPLYILTSCSLVQKDTKAHWNPKPHFQHYRVVTLNQNRGFFPEEIMHEEEKTAEHRVNSISLL